MMSWPVGTRDQLYGFRSKDEIEYSKHFYRNINPIGIDQFKSVIINHSQNPRYSKESELQLGVGHRFLKNSLNIRSKITRF